MRQAPNKFDIDSLENRDFVVSHDGESEFEESLAQALERHAPHGGRCVIAVSGGPDSVALALGWSRLAPPRGDHLIIAHFDHGLRPESEDDARFVRGLAEKIGLDFELGRPSRPIKLNARGSIESAARAARYDFLRRVAHERNAALVATGHTADDQVETVLFSLIRGTGFHGLAGMPEERQLGSGVNLIRPLLSMRRACVHRYLDTLGIQARDDASNRDMNHRRNRVRHELLPMLRQRFNRRADEAILRMANFGAQAAALLDRLAASLLSAAIISQSPHEVTLDAAMLRSAEPLVAAEALRALWIKQGWPRRRLGQAEVDRLMTLLESAGPCEIHLPDRIVCRLRPKPLPLVHLEGPALDQSCP